MGLTRCYKTEVFFTFITFNATFLITLSHTKSCRDPGIANDTVPVTENYCVEVFRYLHEKFVIWIWLL